MIKTRYPLQVYPGEVKLLHDSEVFKFHLTGSRAFGLDHILHPLSDWDFFAQDSLKIRTFLESNGFETESESYRDDHLTTMLYRKPIASSKIHIDIQLIVNMELKIKIEDALIASFPTGLPTFEDQVEKKIFTKRLWSFGRRLAQTK